MSESYVEYASGLNTRKSWELIKRGVHFHPQQYEHLFVCTGHTTEDVQKCITAAEQALKAIA